MRYSIVCMCHSIKLELFFLRSFPTAEVFLNHSGFLDHIIDTYGITPLDEWSTRRRGLYLRRTTQHRNTRDKRPCPQRGSNPRPQQPSGRRPTSQTARLPRSAQIRTSKCKNQLENYYYTFKIKFKRNHAAFGPWCEIFEWSLSVNSCTMYYHDLPSARNGNLEMPVYLFKAKQGYTARKMYIR
jgi:hypothetical protein